MANAPLNLHLRPANPADAGTIAEFNAAMALETEQVHLDDARLLAGVRAVLADPAKGFYVAAESAGEIIGQILITYEWSDWRNGNFWWIQSVYVRPDYRGRGVFRMLYRHIEELAKAEGNVCGLRLYVERENQRAQKTYLAMGMTKAAYDLFEVDYVLKR